MGGETGPLPDGWRVHSGGDVQERWRQGEQRAGRAWMCAWWPVRLTSDGEGESWWQDEPNFFPWLGRPCRAVATVGPCMRTPPRKYERCCSPQHDQPKQYVARPPLSATSNRWGGSLYRSGVVICRSKMVVRAARAPPTPPKAFPQLTPAPLMISITIACP